MLVETITFAFATPSLYAALPDKTLIYCSEGSPAGFDPGQYTSDIEYSASAATVYNRLVEFGAHSMKIEPSLAESWNISKDGRVYTFHLRHGVKFHITPWFTPSREFNAEDVLFTFERVRNPNMAFRRAYPTVFPNLEAHGFDKIIKNIEAPDPHTVRFTLKSANAPFLSNLATPPASILSAEYAAQLLKEGKPSEINKWPVGTGPFIFQEYIKDATIRFADNPVYWKTKDVQLSHLLFAITPDASVRLQKLKRHECHVSVYPRSSDIAVLKHHPDLRVLKSPGFNLGYLAYNTTRKPLDNARVRRALDMAIDKKAIIDAVYEGHAQVAVAPMPPLQWSYDKNLKDRPRHLKRAKTLLTQAGYPDGFLISLWAMPVTRPYNPNARLMAEMIQSDWAEIGVTAKIIQYEWGEYIKRAHDGEHDAMLIGGVSDSNDPSIWFSNLSCDSVRGGNFSKWCYSPFENLIQQAARITNTSQRTRLYLQAQKIFKREQPFTPIAYATDYQIINKRVRNFKINPFGYTVFYGVGLSKN